jgi:AraC family transcriptional activator of pobA
MLNSRPPGFLEQAGSALHAEGFSGGLARGDWVIEQEPGRRAHLLVIETRSGSAELRGTVVRFEAPALLWLPGEIEGDLQVEAGAQGYFVAISDDLLTRTVAGSAEALHLRRTTNRLIMLSGTQIDGALDAVTNSCDMLVRELRTPRRGSMTMISSHVLQLCLHLWRSAVPENPAAKMRCAATDRGWSEISCRWSNCIIATAGRSHNTPPFSA